MNPILIKPTTDTAAQVILKGKVFSNMNAEEYVKIKPDLKSIVMESYNELNRKYNVIVIEGAGSPAEINLRDNDIVNMGMAAMADAPVILVADIDKGGVFASIVGTIALLTDDEKTRVKGIIINKFRGDIKLLRPGIDVLEKIIGIPVIGVIPYMEINLEDEDSVTERFKKKKYDNELIIDVVKLPRISNFSDFDAFNIFDDVSVNFVERADEINSPDILILPGTKNTLEDMRFVRESGIEKKILEHCRNDKTVIGICGGYQMLGSVIEDPSGIESGARSIDGLGVFDMKTVITTEKSTKQVTGEIISGGKILRGLEGKPVKGYEIHMGVSSCIDPQSSLCSIHGGGSDGTVKGNVFGTYIHGIFDSAEFTRGLLNNIRESKGLSPVAGSQTFAEKKEIEFDRLAGIVRSNIDMKKIYNILYGDRVAYC